MLSLSPHDIGNYWRVLSKGQIRFLLQDRFATVLKTNFLETRRSGIWESIQRVQTYSRNFVRRSKEISGCEKGEVGLKRSGRRIKTCL
jgi:hypothetical protein